MADSRRVVEEEAAVLEATVVEVAAVAVEALLAELEMSPEANGIQLHHLLHH
jgi:hypothetical protein